MRSGTLETNRSSSVAGQHRAPSGVAPTVHAAQRFAQTNGMTAVVDREQELAAIEGFFRTTRARACESALGVIPEKWPTQDPNS
jgi:hypothetical protein